MFVCAISELLEILDSGIESTDTIFCTVFLRVSSTPRYSFCRRRPKSEEGIKRLYQRRCHARKDQKHITRVQRTPSAIMGTKK